MARNPANDVTFYCRESEWLIFDPILGGSLEIVSVEPPDALDFAIELQGVFVNGTAFNGEFDSFKLDFFADFYIQYPKSNWVKWGKIGEFDFTQDRTNLAGEMPMDWPGDIWAIGKLDRAVIVYGSGGITVLQPTDTVFARRELLSLGLKSKGAILLTQFFHLFITSDGCLWKMEEKLERLGYVEFLSSMSNPVISYDRINKLAYICNGTLGYVLNCETYSMGAGPVNISGIGYFDGVPYIIASGSIINPEPYLTFHSTDFSNRNFKTVTEVEVGGEFDGLELGVSFRSNTDSYTGPVWFTVTSEGRAFPNIFAKEFKFHLSSEEDLRLDYFNVKGIFADFNPIDGYYDA